MCRTAHCPMLQGTPAQHHLQGISRRVLGAASWLQDNSTHAQMYIKTAKRFTSPILTICHTSLDLRLPFAFQLQKATPKNA